MLFVCWQVRMQEGLETKAVVTLIRQALIQHRILHKNEGYCNFLCSCSG